MVAFKSRLFRASLFAALFMALGLGLTSCGAGGDAQTGETGGQAVTSKSIALDLKFPTGYSYNRARGELSGYGAQTSRLPSYITRITLTISGNGIEPITLDVPLDTLAVTVFLSKGAYTFTITVYTSIGVTFTASTTSEIGSATAPPISFDLDVNSPPTLDSLTGGRSITSAERATLTAVASDLDPGDTLTYQWSASGGSITGSGNTATFSSTTQGTYTITVLVSDGHGGTATGSVRVIVLNSPPKVSIGVSMSPITTAERATLTAMASDTDLSDTLTYQWSVSGSPAVFRLATGPTITGAGRVVTFSSEMPGTYTITVTVSDGRGGAATANAQVIVKTPPNPCTRSDSKTVRLTNVCGS